MVAIALQFRLRWYINGLNIQKYTHKKKYIILGVCAYLSRATRAQKYNVSFKDKREIVNDDDNNNNSNARHFVFNMWDAILFINVLFQLLFLMLFLLLLLKLV